MLIDALAFKVRREEAFLHRQPKRMLLRLPAELVTLIDEDTAQDRRFTEWFYSDALEMGATRALGIHYGMQAFLANGDKVINRKRTPEYEPPLRTRNHTIKATDTEVIGRIAGFPARLAEVTARLTSDSLETFMIDGIRILGALAAHPNTDLVVATDKVWLHRRSNTDSQLSYAAKASPHLDYSKMSPLPKEFR